MLDIPGVALMLRWALENPLITGAAVITAVIVGQLLDEPLSSNNALPRVGPQLGAIWAQRADNAVRVEQDMAQPSLNLAAAA